ncbi:MAG TPA: ABC transporter ATP-binding protein [Alphaproteobacteria bacterium]
MTPRLHIEGLSVAQALDDVSLQAAAGEVVALLGANGAGKSSLLRAIMGFAASRGEIRLDGASLAPLPPFERSRQGVAYCPEGRRVFPRMTVHENLEVARRRGVERLDEIYVLFPALVARANTPAGQLSGGEQQMLAIGRALMTEPKLILLDEPSLGLSPQASETILGGLRRIVSRGAAVLVAEQNAAKALAIADRAYLLRLGKIVREGPAAALRGDPDLERAFLGG